MLGWPVAHSLSPLIHSLWAAREGANAFYAPIAVPPRMDDLRRAVDALQTLGFAGCNVTLPHKEHALALAKFASDEALSAGAANMLTFTTRGVEADNSDIEGLAHSLAAAPGRGRAVLLGAGGAARGALVALTRRLGFASVAVANRTFYRAEAMSREMGVEVLPWADRSRSLAGADLLVNATSLGMTGEAPLDIDTLRQELIATFDATEETAP